MKIDLTNEFCGLVDKAVDRAFEVMLQDDGTEDTASYTEMLNAVYEELVGNSSGTIHAPVFRNLMLAVERRNSQVMLYKNNPVLQEGTEDTAEMLLGAVKEAFLEEHYSELLETFWDKQS